MPNEPLRRADYHENRDRLLAAAQEIISERGPGALSISEVARRTGLNRTTAHAHFATRDDLITAVKAHTQRQTIEMLSANKPLEEWIDHLVERLVDDPAMQRFAVHDLLDGGAPNHEGWRRYTAWFERIAKEQGEERGPDPEFMAPFLIAIVYVWPLLARIHYDESELPAARKRLSQEIKRLLLYGFIDPERAPEMVSALAASN